MPSASLNNCLYKAGLLVCFFFCSMSINGQRIIYVDEDAFGLTNGFSWTDAYVDLRTAVIDAKDGDQIWIASGVYPTSKSGNRFATFDINKSIEIHGGFRGGESSLEERPVNAITTISGEIGFAGASSDNAYHVFRFDQPNSNIVIEGLTISGAHGDFVGEGDFELDETGAVLIDNQGNSTMQITFENVVFKENYAADKGAGVYIQDKTTSKTSVTFKGCIFTEDYAQVDGSAIYGNILSDKASITLESSTVHHISSNRLSFTAIQILFRGKDNALNIKDCDFNNNQTIYPDPILAFGLNDYTNLTLSQSTFKNNNYGQAMFVNAAGGDQATNVVINEVSLINNETFSSPLQVLNTAFGLSRSNVSIDDLTIENNINGDTWILIDLHEVNLLSFDNNTFVGNKGGPLFLNPIYNDLEINNLIVANNSFLDVDFTNQFVIKNFENYDITFNNATFAFNDGVKGTIFRSFFNKDNGKISRLTFNNSIFFGNEDFGLGQPEEQLFYVKNTSVSFNHCLLDVSDCGEVATIEGLGNVTCENSNLLSADPFFVSNSDFNLDFCSPAIDAGNNDLIEHVSRDIKGEERIINDHVDIGAYERIPVTRNFGFSCDQGLIYSDWLPSLSQDVQVNYIEENFSNLLNGQASYALIGESGCSDTLIVDVLPLDGIDMQIPNARIEAALGDTIQLSFINYLANDVSWHVFYEEEKIDFLLNERQLSFYIKGSGAYTIIAVNEYGCFYKEQVDVEVSDLSSLVYLPNSVSPNGDLINDDILVYSSIDASIEIVDFKLYNRWGNPIVSASGLTLEESVTLVPGAVLNELDLTSGVYVYVLHLIYEGQPITLSGDITVF